MLSKFLERLGIDWDALTEEERKTYDTWQQILDKPEPTVDDLLKFLKSEEEKTTLALLDYDIPEKKRIFLQATSRLVRMLTAILTAPGQEREVLKQQIEQMIQN